MRSPQFYGINHWNVGAPNRNELEIVMSPVNDMDWETMYAVAAASALTRSQTIQGSCIVTFGGMTLMEFFNGEVMPIDLAAEYAKQNDATRVIIIGLRNNVGMFNLVSEWWRRHEPPTWIADELHRQCFHNARGIKNSDAYFNSVNWPFVVAYLIRRVGETGSGR